MKKITIILLSTLSAFIIMSSGYGLWKKGIIIKGKIDVVPDPNVIASLEASIEQKYREIDALLEEQRIQEELRLLEEQKILEEQKKLEEENSEIESTLPPTSEKIDNEENGNEIEVEIIIEDEVSDSASDDPEQTATTIEEIIDEVDDSSSQP